MTRGRRSRGEVFNVTIFRDIDGKLIQEGAEHANETCDACGRRPDACWVGPRTITLCYHCAVEVSPSLIADAMRAHSRDRSWLLKTKDKMLERFWYAAALALGGDTPTHGSVEREAEEQHVRILAAIEKDAS
jgi:hypothetical protein